ncbi:14073_t:CDS:2 [Cetraspora pellucida]|uniref:U6 snRNA phosphodiesterase n=1 Tax=Cetraspora pellucida TaxID=1433469 RepID=A0A9N9GH58_9GLOM|nr:14073_t:CDS:2 [Cetraspora pellucida]
MKGLVDYTSSSDNDSEEELNRDIKKHIKETPSSENKNIISGKGVKRKAKDIDKYDTETETGSVLTPKVKTKKLPPLPLEFLELYQDERRKNYTKHIEDPLSHQGRTRAKPHVEGNWATHVYMEVVIPEDFKSLLRKMKSCAQNAARETSFKFFENDMISSVDSQKIVNDSKLHISLSRPLFLKYFQIEKFWENLRKGFENKKRFSLSFSEISHFTNDDKTRSFLALEVGGGVNELKILLEHVNKVAKDFRQNEFYENPRFHASVLWSLGDKPIYESLRDTVINSGFEDIIRDYVFIINKMVCKIGNKTFFVELL